MSKRNKRKVVSGVHPLTSFVEKLTVIVLLVIIAVSPYVFTQFYTGISFEHTGQIGDTIGGITAPFVNILAAFLVYRSFTAQIRANQIQVQNHRDEMDVIKAEHGANIILEIYDRLERDYMKSLGEAKGYEGQADKLRNGVLSALESDPKEKDKDIHGSSKFSRANDLIDESIRKVNYQYLNMNLFLNICLETIAENDKKVLADVATFCLFKLGNLFEQNHFSWLRHSRELVESNTDKFTLENQAEIEAVLFASDEIQEKIDLLHQRLGHS
ncbi:MAG: hypothetical protein AAFU57_13825 [Bacteroidota bacterium]